MITVAVATPSRGLVHSRTVAAVLDNIGRAENLGYARPVRKVGWWAITHDLPIPDAHEATAAAAIATGADAVWFVEEDNVPPLDALVELVKLLGPGVGMAAMDYPLATNPVTHCIYHDPATGEPLWCGLGCTLIPRSTFELLPAAWATSGKAVEMIGRQTRVVDHEPAYGGQDIWLSHLVREAGLRIAETTGRYCGHLRVAATGAPGTNHGAHGVVELGPIERFH